MLSQSSETVYLSDSEYQLYSRHILLKNIGVNGQIRMKKAKILCIGAGGLASSSLMYLAAAGVGSIGIIDDDKIELSNLQRQILYTYNDLEAYKVNIAKNKIKSLNPFCHVSIYNEKLNCDNVSSIILNYDIILDSTDNLEVRYLISKFCLKYHKVHVYGAVQGFKGQVSVFNYKNGPSYYDLYPEFANENLTNCIQQGVVGFLPGIVGILQSIEIMKLISGVGEILSGYLLIYDALNISFKKVRIRSYNIRNYTSFYDDSNKTISSSSFVSHQELHKLMRYRKFSVLLIDIRNYEEFFSNRLEFSINISIDKIKNIKTIEYLQYKSKKIDIIICCNSISRSLIVTQVLSNYNIKSRILLGGVSSLSG